MQRQRQRRGSDELFGAADTFGRFRGFGMMPSLFGDRDPFDDPFFSRPFGSLFESSRLERIPSSSTGGVAYHNHTRSKDLVIEELASDDEGEMEGVKTGDEKKHNHQTRRGSSAEPSVEHPDEDEAENVHDHDHGGDSKDKDVNHRIGRDNAERTEPLRRNFSFQTCKVTNGGVNGTYYTSTRTRRAGSDGVVIEERKEADKTTGEATHNITRGIHDKLHLLHGHSVTRKLNAAGNVDTSQTLHNLNEDELTGFEEAWKGNFRGPLSNWSSQFNKHGARGSSSSELGRMRNWGGFLLPSNAKGRGYDSESSTSSSGGRTKKVIRINID